MNLSSQRRIAGKILKCGIRRIFMNPERTEDISKAITREDIKALIKEGAILVKPERGISRGRFKKRYSQKKKGRRKGYGSREGKQSARNPKKKSWVRKIRAIRDELKKIREEEKIDEKEYRMLYRKAKGNLFLSRRHLREQIEKTKK